MNNYVSFISRRRRTALLVVAAAVVLFKRIHDFKTTFDNNSINIQLINL